MKHTKLYDLIKKILNDYPECRDSDKKLVWQFWKKELLIITDGFLEVEYIRKNDFIGANSGESVTRVRRMVQADHPELGPSQNVKRLRKELQRQKGTHVYREPIFDNKENKVRFIE